MLVITEVCSAYGSLGHAVIELNKRETEIFLRWQEEVRQRQGKKDETQERA
jgi:hypothetical protein